MISLDKTLLGADYSGDVLERHQEYAQYLDALDIVVFSKKGFKERKFSSRLAVYPTNSLTKLNYFYDVLKAAKKIFDKNKIDLIVTQDPFLTGWTGWRIKKKNKIPLLIHFHGDFWGNRYWLRERWFNWLLLFLSRFLVKRADGIRVMSSGIKKKLVKRGIAENKIRVIPTPVDLEKFEKFDENKVRKLKERYAGRKIIINVGRKDPSKDYKTLYQAIKLVYDNYKNLAFWQAGNQDNLAGEIKADENLTLTSVGKIGQEELTNYYHASDIYVSSSKHESFGKVLVEAMAAGLPVVATATTGSQEIVKDGVNGFLAPIGDSAALVKKILCLLDNPEMAREMGQAGRKMVKERFDQEKVIEKIIKFWEELVFF